MKLRKLTRARMRRLTKIVLTFTTLALTLGLAGAGQARPGRTTNAPPPLSASDRNADLSALTSKLAELHIKRHKRLTVREVKALGLTPVPKQLATKLNKVAESTRASAAAVGDTYWYTYHYHGHFYADVYYSGPFLDSRGDTTYSDYNNYKICDWHGNNCIGLNVDTYVYNIDIGGTYYFYGRTGDQTPENHGIPVYGWGPFPDTPGY
ncbi:MAG: hypothetical protein JO120_07550 [Solirubrobacterales bacterium]|nr:hypothetical protein [Solirubrobacterales bacterium]